MDNNFSCRICSNTTNNKLHIAREMMFAFRDEFEYYECSHCGCLQIKEIPSNLEKYYPNDYYSYQETGDNLTFKKKFKEKISKFFIRMRLHGNETISNCYKRTPWIQKEFLHFNSNILDIGCGAGNLLKYMNRIGFKKLTGADPFISKDIHYDSGITIHKKFTHEIEGKFDFVMLHHSFEHMDNPLQTLKDIHTLLNDHSFVLIRIPVANSFCWRKYGVNWYQLDAPRHFFLHTTQSIRMLCDQSGFQLKKVFFDSNRKQFINSEKYLRDIPLTEPYNSFNRKEIRYFKQEAKRLNKLQDGDSACFYLQKR